MHNYNCMNEMTTADFAALTYNSDPFNPMRGAQGKAGGDCKTVYVHMTGYVVRRYVHPIFRTEFTVEWDVPENYLRGPRRMVETFASKREAWEFLGSKVSDPRDGITIH